MTAPADLLPAIAAEYRSLKASSREVRADDTLEDLGVDSLVAQELLASLEDRYDIELIGDARLAKMVTVGDLIDLVLQSLSARARA